jgi:aminoacrylate hydrolase
LPEFRLRDGARLHYESCGSGPPLLLVPGLGGVATFWQRHLPAFAARFRVVTHDHRGCGRSGPSRIEYSVEQMASDVLELMDGLGIERAHFLGHSTGGAIGQTLALDHPARIDRLILSATWTAADAYFARLFATRREALAGLGAEFYVRLGNLVLYPPAWLAANVETLERAQRESAIPPTPDEIVDSRIAAILRFDRSGELTRIGHRTLVCCARDDIVTPSYFSERLAQAIAQARLVVFPTGGHFYNHVAPAAFEAMVLDFLGGA